MADIKFKSVATYLGLYYQALINNGVSAEVADALVEDAGRQLHAGELELRGEAHDG